MRKKGRSASLAPSRDLGLLHVTSQMKEERKGQKRERGREKKVIVEGNGNERAHT